ncbi:hypothetical protein L596_027251 [Steinernema carpocapsae]|uniref:Secreted protein n=1 Tax=Steinernema carpocapsae TaxID=34508 RepID=A0A4U5M3R7_STECR|nr:hypothetical protein L596_027251 [Steinernema carpocapsae]
MASFLFFHALLTLVAADDRLLHYSLSVTKPLSFKSPDMCWDSTVDSATNVLNIVRCPYTACMAVYFCSVSHDFTWFWSFWKCFT